MTRYDSALLVLLGIALLIGGAVFRGRRRHGTSRAIATFAAGCAIGGVIALAFMLMYDQFMPPRASIGLERIVGPIVTMFVSVIGSAVLGGLVFLFDARRPSSGTTTMSADAAAMLRSAAERSERRR